MEKQVIRDSNFELLRIVAIIGIICHHLLINGIDVCGYNNPYNLECGSIGVFLNSFVVGGVNLFLLISGWYGIKCNKILSTTVSLIVDNAKYVGVVLFFVYLIMGTHFSVGEIWNNVKFTQSWYLANFIILVLLSPIIESTLANVRTTQLGKWVLLLTIVNVIFGYYMLWVNPNGYNAVNFIYLYFIGRYLRLLKEEKPQYYILSKYSWLIFILSSAFMAVLYLTLAYLGKTPESVRFWSYNSPWVLISSISFFTAFSTLKIRNSCVNKIATTVLGVYLIHTCTAVTSYRNNIALSIYSAYGYMGVFGYALVIFTACSLLTMSIDYLSKPITNKIKIINK